MRDRCCPELVATLGQIDPAHPGTTRTYRLDPAVRHAAWIACVRRLVDEVKLQMDEGQRAVVIAPASVL